MDYNVADEQVKDAAEERVEKELEELNEKNR